MMMKQKIILFSIVCFTTIILLSCARLTTTHSTFKVQDSALEKIQALVDSVFSEMGYSMSSGQKQRWYYIWGEKNKFGRPVRYSFEVTYKLVQDNVVIRIENEMIGAEQEVIRIAQERLSAVSSQIKRRFDEANIVATIETNSWSLITVNPMLP